MIDVLVRTAKQEDFKTIYCLVQEAFLSATHSDGQEQELVKRIWESSDYLSDLSLVAEINGEIVGYLLLSKVKIATAVALALAPLAVRPDVQKMGGWNSPNNSSSSTGTTGWLSGNPCLGR